MTKPLKVVLNVAFGCFLKCYCIVSRTKVEGSANNYRRCDHGLQYFCGAMCA